MNQKIVAMLATIVSIAVPGITLNGGPARAQEFGSPELIAAAKAEGKLVFYTANFAEIEQEVIKAFNKRFPEIKVVDEPVLNWSAFVHGFESLPVIIPTRN